MKSENKNVFTITNDKGETIECEVILTIESNEFHKNYIVYTDHTMDDTGGLKTYASIYDPTGKSLDLEPVTTDEEWDMIEAILTGAQKQIAQEENNNKEN